MSIKPPIPDTIIAELRAVIASLEAENDYLRSQLAYVRSQSSSGFARGQIKNAAVSGEIA